MTFTNTASWPYVSCGICGGALECIGLNQFIHVNTDKDDGSHDPSPATDIPSIKPTQREDRDADGYCTVCGASPEEKHELGGHMAAGYDIHGNGANRT